MKKYLVGLFIMLLFLELRICVKAKNFNISIKEESTEVTVKSKSGPWDPVINKSKNYIHKFRVKRNGLDPPTVIRVKPNNNLTIECIFGDVYTEYLRYPERKTDASGYPKSMNTYSGVLPSFYINDQVNHMALIGTFADSKGVIVGTPFGIGNGPVNIDVPQGAKQLQLGVNDNLFRDNSGLFIVKININ